MDESVFLGRWSHPLFLYLFCLGCELLFFTIAASSASMWVTTHSLTLATDSTRFRIRESLKGLAHMPFTKATTTISLFDVGSQTEKAK